MPYSVLPSTDVSMSDITFNSVALQETGSGTDTVKVQAPSAVTTSYTLTMPGAVGASGQILRTSDASGTLEWVTDEEGDLKSVADATNGGLDVTNGTYPDVTLAVDFNDLAAAVVDVAADSIGILDATDNDTKKETIADLVSAMGGTGLTGASGQLSVDAAQTQITSVGALDAWEYNVWLWCNRQWLKCDHNYGNRISDYARWDALYGYSEQCDYSYGPSNCRSP